jgi:hypothetical protein
VRYGRREGGKDECNRIGERSDIERETDDIGMIQAFQNVHLTPNTTLIPFNLPLTYNLQRHVLLHTAIFVFSFTVLTVFPVFTILILPTTETENGLGRRSSGESLSDRRRARATILGFTPRPETQQA